MGSRVVLDLGCCPAGSRPERAVRRGGGKAVVLDAAQPVDLHPGLDSPLHPLPGSSPDGVHDPSDRSSDASPDGSSRASARAGRDVAGWLGRVAGVVGMDPAAVAAGVPVPLAHHLVTWADVRRESEHDRCDVLVVRVAPREAVGLLDAPDLLLRTLDARLEALAPAVGADAGVASEVAGLLALRPDLLAARALADGACVTGATPAHGGHGCPGLLGAPAVEVDEPTGDVLAGTEVRPVGEGFVWCVAVPPGSVPRLARDGDRVVVAAGEQRRTLRLPAALARCRARAATVVADRLQVHLAPDPDAWR